MSDRDAPCPIKRIDFDLLDQLRGLAAMGVVIGHSRGILFVGGRHLQQTAPISQWGIADTVSMALLALTRLSSEFVIFFFVLSGFSIAYSLDRRPSAGQFFFRRMIRLYPTYLGGLLWAALVFLLTSHIQPDFYSGAFNHVTFKNLAATRDFLQWPRLLKDLIYIPYGFLIEPYWSLSHEVLFYLLAPLLLRFPRPYFFFSAVAYLSGWWIEGAGFSAGGIPAAFLLDFNIYFMIGIAVFHNWDKVCSVLYMSKARLATVLLGIHLSSIALGLLLGGVSKYSSALFALGAVILMANVHNHRLFSPTLSFLGAASYSIYITHFSTLILLLSVVHLFILPPYIYSKVLWLLGIPIGVLGSMPVFLFIEKRTKTILDLMRKAA